MRLPIATILVNKARIFFGSVLKNRINNIDRTENNEKIQAMVRNTRAAVILT
jgi:hypothetical protein